MKISVIGAGYVGLVTGVCLSSFGHRVTILDKNNSKIRSLTKGNSIIFEKDLPELLRKQLKKKKLLLTSSYDDIAQNDVFIICVDTPFINKKPYKKNLIDSIESLLSVISDDSLIIIKSTAPIGTFREIESLVNKRKMKKNVSLCVHPEFLREGSAVSDFLNPERIVFGTRNPSDIDLFKEIYCKDSFQEKILIMSPESAELTKYAANGFLATKISFINEISRISERCGADIEEIKLGLGTDSRIGDQFLNSGIGFGGSCFPKDLQSLSFKKSQLRLPDGILEAALDGNELQLQNFVDKILEFKKENKISFENFSLCIWGMSFKPNTNDLRDSQSIKLVQKLIKHCKKINIYDPVCKKSEILKQFSNNSKLTIFNEKYKSIKNTLGLVIATEWDEFKNLDFDLVKTKVIFDGRNCIDKIKCNKNNIQYVGIGRG